MKRLLIASLSSLLLGFFTTEQSKAAIYTHNLTYTDSDHGNSLTARVSFDDSNLISSNYPDGVSSFGNGNFITDITFTYTSGGVPTTITSDDFNTSTARVRIEYS